MYLLSGIEETQVGEPLVHRARLDRSRTGSTSLGAAAHAEDEQVAELIFAIGDAAERCVMAKLCAEGGPSPEGGGGALASLLDRGLAGEVERSAEISSELCLGCRCKSFQGASCRWACSKWARKALSERCCRREASSAITLAGPGM